MNVDGNASVGVVGVVTEDAPRPSVHAMTVREAIDMADRWSAGWGREEAGGLGECLSVLVNHIVVLEGRVREAQRAVIKAHDQVQALTLDLAFMERGRDR
jgi:hypothetical protein